MHTRPAENQLKKWNEAYPISTTKIRHEELIKRLKMSASFGQQSEVDRSILTFEMDNNKSKMLNAVSKGVFLMLVSCNITWGRN